MTVTARTLTNYQVEIQAGNHTFRSDEPLGTGDDTGPGPFDLVLGGLASCTIITLHMYAKRKKWPLERVEVQMDMRGEEFIKESGEKGRTTIIDAHVTFFGPLTYEQIQRLEDIAGRCPVHKMLSGEIHIQTTARAQEPGA